jgi:hypothetical protein
MHAFAVPFSHVHTPPPPWAGGRQRPRHPTPTQTTHGSGAPPAWRGRSPAAPAPAQLLPPLPLCSPCVCVLCVVLAPLTHDCAPGRLANPACGGGAALRARAHTPAAAMPPTPAAATLLWRATPHLDLGSSPGHVPLRTWARHATPWVHNGSQLPLSPATGVSHLTGRLRAVASHQAQARGAASGFPPPPLLASLWIQGCCACRAPAACLRQGRRRGR